MKSYIILILLAFCFADDSELRFLSENKIDDIKYNIYSMVWSAKFFNPFEKNIFYFDIPMTFNTYMSINSNKGVISLGFPNASIQSENFKILKEEAIKAQESSYSPIINFSNDYTHIDLNISNSDEFKLVVKDVFENQFSKSIQIRIIQPKHRVRSLYVTFDFAKDTTPEKDINTFIDYLNSKQ